MKDTELHEWRNKVNNVNIDIPNSQTIKNICFEVLQQIFIRNWVGACHQTSGIIHILLNESGIDNIWAIGEAKVGKKIFNHSWIIIDSEIYDLAICKPLQYDTKTGPVIRTIDLDKKSKTTTKYGIISGKPDDEVTKIVKIITLSDYLKNNVGIHPNKGAWHLIDRISQNLKLDLNIPQLMKKYNGRHYTVFP